VSHADDASHVCVAAMCPLSFGRVRVREDAKAVGESSGRCVSLCVSLRVCWHVCRHLCPLSFGLVRARENAEAVGESTDAEAVGGVAASLRVCRRCVSSLAARDQFPLLPSVASFVIDHPS
jgi:hypothetical protein